eukprot:g3341.t1
MSSKARGGGGGRGDGGGGDGDRDKKKKKKKGDKGEKCKKCKTLFPIMYKMKDLLTTLQPQCNQYRLELEAVKAENEKLRRRLGLPSAPTTVPTTPAAAAAASTAAGAEASIKKTKTLSYGQAQATNTDKPATASGGARLGNGSFGGGGYRDSGSDRNGGKQAASAPGATAAAAAATPRKERSKGEKIRDWTAAVARSKRGRSNGDTAETPADRGGSVVGGCVDKAGGDGGSGSDIGDERGVGAEAPSRGTPVPGGAKGAGKSSDCGDNGATKEGKGKNKAKEKKKKKKKKKKKETVLKPAGVFAAAEFSFMDDGKENDDEEEEEEDDEESTSDSDGSGGGRNQQRKPRKRARTTARGGAASNGRSGSGGVNGGPVPRTSSMLARGFQARGDDVGAPAEGRSNGVDDDGWGEGQIAQEVEWYEDIPNEMEGLGWSKVWRRSDALAVGGREEWDAGDSGGDEDGGGGDGLDEGSRALARKSLKLIDAASAKEADSAGLLGPKALSKLLRLELTGAVTMNGVLLAVVRGRSLARDAGFLGRLVLRVIEGIDGAHAAPLTDPDVLTLVVEELEGLAELVALPSSGIRGIGWGRETHLALEFLTKTLLEGLDRARWTVAGDAEEDAPGGYSSMSFGNSKKKKKKSKENQSKPGGSDGAGGETGSGWTAEAEAPVLWWWETDEAGRVPWALARLLGLLLRRLRKPEHSRTILHSILVRCLGGPSRLLRFPLAFLEAFPGYFLPPHFPQTATAAAAAVPSELGSSNIAENESGEATRARLEAVEGAGGALAPGLWRRAVKTVMFPPGGDGGSGVGGGGAGGVGAAVVSDRLRVMCLGEEGGSNGGDNRGDGVQEGARCIGRSPERVGRRETPDKLAEEILESIGALHLPQEGMQFGDDGEGCALCCGLGGDGGDCGGDDALAMSSGLCVVEGRRDELFGELATPRCRGELVAVEALRALQLLGTRTDIGGVSVGGIGGGGGGARPRARMMDVSVTHAARVLREALESDPRTWEVGQIEEGFQLSHRAKAHAASALLALLNGRYGEVAAESERFIVEWTQRLEPKDRLSTPLPLLLSTTGLLSRPPAHVINLARRPYRWKALSDVARREGVLLYQHVAVDALGVEVSSLGTGKGFISDKDVTMTWATELNTMHDKDCEKATTVNMHPSERACAASHLDLWKRHRAGKLAPFMPEVHPDAVLILEDDAQLKPGFLESARATMLQATVVDRDPKTKKIGLKKRWDILYLGHILPIPIINGISHSLKAKSGVEVTTTDLPPDAPVEDAVGVDPAPPPTPPTAPASNADVASSAPSAPAATTTAAEALGLHVAPVTFAWGLHAYLLTRAAAAVLVDHLPVSAPADIFVGSFLAATDSGRPMLAGRAVLPALATTPAGGGGGGAAAAAAGGGAVTVGGVTGTGEVGDVVSVGTRRAGVAHGVWFGRRELKGRMASVEGEA